MRRNRDIILAIKPGTRILWYEVTVNGEIIDSGRKHVRGAWSEEKQTKISNKVKQLMIRYNTDKIEIKMPYPGRSSKALDHLIDKLHSIIKHYNSK